MDTKIYKKLETIGAILVLPEKQQISLLEKYLQDHHAAAFELAQLYTSAKGRTKNEEVQLVKNYKAWLLRHDKSWHIANKMWPYRSREDWKFIASETGLSDQTCRQAIQALRRCA